MIMDYKTTNNSSDKGQLTEMGKTAKEFLEVDKSMNSPTPGIMTNDMLEAEKNGITCLVPKGKDGNQRSRGRLQAKRFHI